jgi:hypothetical protein
MQLRQTVVPMRLDGSHEGALKPSSDWRFHLDILRAREDVQAVTHARIGHCVGVLGVGPSAGIMARHRREPATGWGLRCDGRSSVRYFATHLGRAAQMGSAFVRHGRGSAALFVLMALVGSAARAETGQAVSALNPNRPAPDGWMMPTLEGDWRFRIAAEAWLPNVLDVRASTAAGGSGGFREDLI